MPDVVIDLGEAREIAQADVVPPQWTLRRLAPFVSMVTVAVLAAAAPPPDPELTHVGSFPARGESVLLPGGAVAVREGDVIVATELNGSRRWRVRVDASPQQFGSMRVEAGTLLVRATQPDGADFATTAVDPATGRLLWRLPGWVERTGEILVQWRDTVAAVYELDGRGLRWETPTLYASVLDGDTGSLFAVIGEGRLVEYDLATGDVRRSAAVPTGPGIDHLSLELGADYVVVATFEGPEGETGYAFRRSTFEPIEPAAARWLTTVDCGPVICAIPRDHSAGTSIVDPRSGIVRWPVPPSQSVVRAGPGDSLLIVGWTDSSRERLALNLVDPWTRHLRRSFTGWTIVTDEESGALTPIWLWRRESQGQTVVARFDAAGLRVLGSVPHHLADCQYAAPMLLCAIDAGTMGVWRVEH